MKVKQIEEEMIQLKERYANLETTLKEIQQNCEHQFHSDPYYKKCSRCHKIEVLYY